MARFGGSTKRKKKIHTRNYKYTCIQGNMILYIKQRKRNEWISPLLESNFLKSRRSYSKGYRGILDCIGRLASRMKKTLAKRNNSGYNAFIVFGRTFSRQGKKSMAKCNILIDLWR